MLDKPTRTARQQLLTHPLPNRLKTIEARTEPGAYNRILDQALETYLNESALEPQTEQESGVDV